MDDLTLPRGYLLDLPKLIFIVFVNIVQFHLTLIQIFVLLRGQALPSRCMDYVENLPQRRYGSSSHFQ